MEAMTAAHRTLAFGTWLRVDNMDNGKRTEVRVTDRGPFVKNRILDLSRAAAREIDMLGPGSARVKLTVIRGAPSPQPKASTASQPAIAPSKDATFAVQVGAFADRSRADHLRRDLEVRFGSAAVRKRDGSAPLWRVIVGNEKTQSAADALASRLLSEFPNAAVVRLDSPQ